MNLSGNNIENLPPSLFSKLTQLKTLSLADNHISQLEENTFRGLNKLKSLNISNNSLRKLQKGVFYGLRRSVNIIVEGNNLSTISTEIFMDPAIQGPITHKLPPLYIEPPSLPYIPITGTPPDPNIQVKICKTRDGIVESIEELKKDEALGNCVGISIDDRAQTSIYVSNLGLRKSRKGWYKLSAFHFEQIDFTDNNIAEITPELLNDLPARMTAVVLFYNGIEIIRKNMIDNQHLKDLYLALNNISIIKEGALEKTTLRKLTVARNRLRSFDFARTLPSTLQVLELHENGMPDIPEDFLDNLKNLVYINLEGKI